MAATVAEQSVEDLRFRQSEMKMASPEHGKSMAARHVELASENEVNIFTNERSVAGFCEVSDSADYSLKNSYGHKFKIAGLTDSK